MIPQWAESDFKPSRMYILPYNIESRLTSQYFLLKQFFKSQKQKSTTSNFIMDHYHQSRMAQSIVVLELVLNFLDALHVARGFRIVLVILVTQN